MLRRILFTAAALAALLLAAAAALPAFFDADALKPRIERAAAESLGRTLRIDGRLKLKLLPRPAVELPATTLSERGSAREFARFDSARVSAALLPLLAGRIEADRLRIAGLQLTIERRGDGSTSIDELIGPPAADSRRGERRLTLAGIDIDGGRLTLLDDGRPSLLLEAMTLSAGAIAPGAATPLRLAADFTLPESAASGRATLNATLRLDPAAGSHALSGLQASASGSLPAGRFELSLAAPRLQFGAALRAERIAADLKLDGETTLAMSLEVAGVSGEGDRASAERLRMTADLTQGGRRIAANVEGPATAQLGARRVALPRLTGEATAGDPARPGNAVAAALAGSARLDLARQSSELRLEAKFDETTLSAQFDIAGFAKPRLRIDAEADRFDADRYRAAHPASPGPAQPAAGTTPIDLAPLRALDLDGRLRIGRLRAAGIEATDVSVAARAAGGRLDMSPMTARLYGGALSGAAFAAADGNRFGLEATLAGVNVAPLLRDALAREPLTGTGDLRLDLSAEGASLDGLKRSLDGHASLRLRDGTIRGFDLVRQLRAAGELMRGARERSQRTDPAQATGFTELSASFAIHDGVARNDDLDARSPLLRLRGAGLVDIGAGRIDFTAQVAATGRLAAEAGRDFGWLQGFEIPVRLAGPFDAIEYRIDWAAAAQEAVRARAAEEVRRRLLPRGEDRRRLEDRAREALKGLLGR